MLLKEIKRHPFTLRGLDNPVQWIEETDPARKYQGRKIEVSSEDVERAVVPIGFLARVRSGMRKVGAAMGFGHAREGRKRAKSSANSADGATSTASTSPTPTIRDQRRPSLFGDDAASPAASPKIPKAPKSAREFDDPHHHHHHQHQLHHPFHHYQQHQPPSHHHHLPHQYHHQHSHSQSHPNPPSTPQHPLSQSLAVTPESADRRAPILETPVTVAGQDLYAASTDLGLPPPLEDIPLENIRVEEKKSMRAVPHEAGVVLRRLKELDRMSSASAASTLGSSAASTPAGSPYVVAAWTQSQSQVQTQAQAQLQARSPRPPSAPPLSPSRSTVVRPLSSDIFHDLRLCYRADGSGGVSGSSGAGIVFRGRHHHTTSEGGIGGHHATIVTSTTKTSAHPTTAGVVSAAANDMTLID
jgi:hypothetical protein